MQLEDVRELKTRLAGSGVSPAPIAARVSARIAYAAQPTSRLSATPRTFAIGVVRKRKGNYHLAIRIQRRSLLDVPQIAAIRKAAKNEVDVRYVGRITKRGASANRTRRRPLKMGISIGHYKITAGTLGAFVTLRSTGEVRILSNNHVLADENRGKAGDAIIQPGDYDSGRNPQDRVGALAEFARVSKTTANDIDAALATIAERVAYEPRLLGVTRRLSGLAHTPVDIDDRVEKVGRTTGHTRGRVTAFELDNVIVTYDMGDVRFDNQIEIEGAGTLPFSDGGDSGSLVYGTKEPVAVGLLFAGGDQGGSNGQGLTYANPIGLVFEQLAIDLVT